MDDDVNAVLCAVAYFSQSLVFLFDAAAVATHLFGALLNEQIEDALQHIRVYGVVVRAAQISLETVYGVSHSISTSLENVCGVGAHALQHGSSAISGIFRIAT